MCWLPHSRFHGRRRGVPNVDVTISDGAGRLKPTTTTPIIGQVALGGLNELRTKIVKGVRYVLLPPETGDLGPRWVREGTHPARNISRIRVDEPSLIKANPSGVAY